jgi:hypothetical protein
MAVVLLAILILALLFWSGKMYVLIGVDYPHYPGETEAKNNVALFTNEQLAETYLNTAKLLTYNNYCYRGQCRKQFRKSSLLYGYCDAYVDVWYGNDLEVNPVCPER